ncbi:hypothetical protein NX722_13710 [Endozoicomonas gorgoniicola]|uniref:C2H2-type domain-containing protein n=1 Tax=Endozoicomonas gorgoniicola TaxID=1234144 RepID=A0ABT3MWC1_9GAMM|nr:hypothetical protein [Endozoicomonas gorgoniicola]MCW7553665.1 hypothetical protein [Endozoicomonas gorgoniicola]
MKPVPVEPAGSVTFRCADCKKTFDAKPTRTEPAPERAHPFRYFSDCPDCGNECPQVHWQVGLFNAHLKATGPKTQKGRSASAANLAGHPTPEEARITRFNAMKHGASAKTAMYFPAKPDKYPHCKTCDVDRDYCAQQIACLKRSDLMLRCLVAIESGDPSALQDLHAINQANFMAIMQDILQALIADGVTLRNPVYGFDKEGGFNIGRYQDPESNEWKTIEEVRAHPLLKPLMDMISRNNLSLADLNMTPKVQVDQGIQQGQLQQEEEEKESAIEYRNKMDKQVTDLRSMIARSQLRANQDPVLIEHRQEDGDEPPKDIEAEVLDDSTS